MGRIILFEVPLSSVQGVLYKSDMRLKERKSFIKKAKDNKITIINNQLKYTDKDFPDLWHLSNSKKGEFTNQLNRIFNSLTF